MCTTVDQDLEDQRELQTLVEEAVHPHTEAAAATTNGSNGGLNGHVTKGTNNHNVHHPTSASTKEESVILVADTKIIHYNNKPKDKMKYSSNEYLESEV